MRRTTEQRLRLATAVYRDALRTGQPPTQAVAEELHISHSHAANLIAKARRHNLLEPTQRGRTSGLFDNPV